MLPAFIVTLREGLEAFLIIAISVAYLRKTGRRELVAAVRSGIALSLVVSVAAAWLFARAANHSLWEGVLAIVAAVSVASLTIHMWRTAKVIRPTIEGRLTASAAKTGTAAFAGVFLFTVLMITREGMETALLIGMLVVQTGINSVVIGATLGTCCAASIGWMWSRYGHRVNLALFFQVTAVFLFVFVVQLLVYGFHELTEARVVPHSEMLHNATEPYGPDGLYGKWLSYLLVLMPVAWLATAGLFSGAQGARSGPHAPGRVNLP